ncbi:hypothetical protein I6N95_15220 [Vagococcus sp. BWB3-3]|uniref:Uncharacterized protein n=1 Tax=Vagococcus allomyrinae TaxID=2794353 RepID=A0A940PCN5_9ENTE|nr:hypothetical protein [Vagococcus allomyrinae]MBP1042370.1 hypothetical protein [Vagococcus allomyrinae]
MKKKLFKISLVTMSSMILGTSLLSSATVMAAENVSTNQSEVVTIANNTLSQTEIEEIADKYITFDAKKQSFIVDNAINNELNPIYTIQVKNQIEKTNIELKNSITEAQKDGSFILRAATSDGTEYSLMREPRAAGVNKVSVYWNFARIFLSKNSVNNIILGGTGGLGALVGFIPGVGIGVAVACGAVLAIVGSKQVKNGIWFDYNYLIGVLTWNWGWQ